MGNTIVYVVTSGSYSDYHIDAVFSEKELAEAYKERWGEPYDSHVGEWDLDSPDPYQHPGLSCFQIQMGRSGDTHYISKIAPPLGEDEIRQSLWKGEPLIEVFCWARDEQHAIKIANERRTRAIAEGRMEISSG